MALTATDSAGFESSAGFDWTITNTVSVTAPAGQSGMAGTAISPLSLTATDTSGAASITWTATGLPAGLSISSAGAITGTPSASGPTP